MHAPGIPQVVSCLAIYSLSNDGTSILKMDGKEHSGQAGSSIDNVSLY